AALALGAGATVFLRVTAERGFKLGAVSIEPWKAGDEARSAAALPPDAVAPSSASAAAPAAASNALAPSAHPPEKPAPAAAGELVTGFPNLPSVPEKSGDFPLPLGGVPQRSVPAGQAGNASVTPFRILARAGGFGLDLVTASKQCGDVGMSLCME